MCSNVDGDDLFSCVSLAWKISSSSSVFTCSKARSKLTIMRQLMGIDASRCKPEFKRRRRSHRVDQLTSMSICFIKSAGRRTRHTYKVFQTYINPTHLYCEKAGMTIFVQNAFLVQDISRSKSFVLSSRNYQNRSPVSLTSASHALH